jgi:RNA-directed DNA polymerase
VLREHAAAVALAQHPNPGDPSMSRALREIQGHLHQEARRRPWRPLEYVMRFVTDSAVLTAAWVLVRSSHGAGTPGADHLAARDMPADSAESRAMLQELAVQLQSGTYRPGPVRRFEIAKPGQPGKTRPLAILTVRDRVVHMAVKLVVEPMIEARLGDRTFGFRPGRSRYDQLLAVRRLVVNRPEQYGAALTADIASCFDELDHRLILDDLLALIADPAFIRLFQLLLEQVGSGRAGWWRRRPVGVLQGSPLSPVIANWNLARFDAAWRQLHGERAPLFRYADDLILLARDEARAARLRRPLEHCLRRANRLALAADKTRAGALDAGIPLLGLMLRRHVDPFSGRSEVRIFVDPDRFRDLFAETERWLEQIEAHRLGQQIRRFNQRLRGWFESYQYAYDAPQAFEAYDAFLFAAARRRLKELIACSVATLQGQHHRRLPSGHETWEVDGVPLLALSTLPRQRYRARRARPPWELPAEPAAVEAQVAAKETLTDAPAPAAPARLDPVIDFLVRRAATAAVRDDADSVPVARHAEPVEPAVAGNGRLRPEAPPSDDAEGPSHGTT